MWCCVAILPSLDASSFLPRNCYLEDGSVMSHFPLDLRIEMSSVMNVMITNLKRITVLQVQQLYKNKLHCVVINIVLVYLKQSQVFPIIFITNEPPVHLTCTYYIEIRSCIRGDGGLYVDPGQTLSSILTKHPPQRHVSSCVLAQCQFVGSQKQSLLKSRLCLL